MQEMDTVRRKNIALLPEWGEQWGESLSNSTEEEEIRVFSVSI